MNVCVNVDVICMIDSNNENINYEMNAKSPNLPIANNTQPKLITVYYSTMYVRSFVFLVY